VWITRAAGFRHRSLKSEGTNEERLAKRILRVHDKALRIFYFRIGFGMKRRQQGILTGMPFMANVAFRSFIDDLARKIHLPHPPQRIVALAPGVTEMVFALGAGDQIIAVTRECDYPPQAVQKPKVGETSSEVDALTAVKPDLILASRDVVDIDLIDTLGERKVPLYVMEAKTLEDILSHLHTIGRMVNRTEAATHLVTDMRRRIQRVKDRTITLPHPRVLCVLNSRPLMTVGSGTFIHQLIELAGGDNVGAITARPRWEISMEQVRKQNPDVLVLAVDRSEAIPASEQQEWRDDESLSAVRTGRLYRIDNALIARPGPRIVEGLERLAALLHPDAFPDAPSSGSATA
jgi:iron complex transport system substrate-binding protein